MPSVNAHSQEIISILHSNKSHKKKLAALVDKLNTESSLTFKRCNLTNSDFGLLTEAMAQNTSIKALSIETSTLDTQGLSDFAKSLESRPNLKEFEFAFNMSSVFPHTGDYDLSIFKLLANSKSLEKVNIERNKLTPEHINYLLEWLEGSPSLKSLTLYTTSSSSLEALELLVKHLERNTTLSDLNLSSCLRNLFSEDRMKVWAAIGNMLKVNTTLKVLNLSNNNVSGAQEAQALAKGLEKNIALEELRLSGTNLKSEGAQALAQALENNTALKEMALQGNSVGKKGGIALAKMLQSNSTLTSINLNSNGMPPAALKALANALEKNETLKKLGIWGNQELLSWSAHRIEKYLKRNEGLPLKKSQALNKLPIDSADVLNVIRDYADLPHTSSEPEAVELTLIQKFIANFKKGLQSLYQGLKTIAKRLKNIFLPKTVVDQKPSTLEKEQPPTLNTDSAEHSRVGAVNLKEEAKSKPESNNEAAQTSQKIKNARIQKGI